jgi:rhamnogalacturonyl hydrolase YesR
MQRPRVPAPSRTELVVQAMLSMQRATWEQGVAAQAFLESGDEKNTYLLAKEAVLRQTKEGRLAAIGLDNNGVTDPAASGEAVLHAFTISGENELLNGAERMANYLMETAPRNEDGILYHFRDQKEIWVDSMYMAPPFLAASGRFQEAVKQLEGMRRLLWNEKAQLFSHRWDDATRNFANPDFWGVGNGWAAAGMARVIQHLPANMDAEKKKLQQYTRALLDGCKQHVRDDGLFHNVIDKPETFVETNLSQMLAYTIFTGIRAGWLGEEYISFAYQLRAAALDKVNEYGYVQDVCGAPFFNSPGRATEGQAFHILMESAKNKYEELK